MGRPHGRGTASRPRHGGRGTAQRTPGVASPIPRTHRDTAITVTGRRLFEVGGRSGRGLRLGYGEVVTTMPIAPRWMACAVALKLSLSDNVISPLTVIGETMIPFRHAPPVLVRLAASS